MDERDKAYQVKSEYEAATLRAKKVELEARSIVGEAERRVQLAESMVAQYAEESVQLYEHAGTNVAAGQEAVCMAAASDKYRATAPDNFF
jgi:delta 1-pyrroline-5-carboxylate dehydrogenase